MSALRTLAELLSGRRPIEKGEHFLRAFVSLPAPVRDLIRWVLRPKLRFLDGRLRAATRGVVHAGPFAGVRMGGRPRAALLAGSYEAEIHPWIERLLTKQWSVVVNIGAADGLYATGMARRLPGVPVVAYEGNPHEELRLRETLAVNGVTAQVQVEGWATPEELARRLAAESNPLVIIDVDGVEIDLLDPVVVPALRRTTILLETHFEGEDETGAIVRPRFESTHDIVVTTQRARTADDLAPDLLPEWRQRWPATVAAMLDERRTSPQGWMLLTPRAH